MDWTDGVDIGIGISPKQVKQIAVVIVAAACLVSAGARSLVGRGIDAYVMAKAHADVQLYVPAFNASHNYAMARIEQARQDALRRDAPQAQSAAPAQQSNGMAQVTVYVGPK